MSLENSQLSFLTACVETLSSAGMLVEVIVLVVKFFACTTCIAIHSTHLNIEHSTAIWFFSYFQFDRHSVTPII